ncbi:MAG TPA: TolC family protein [Candidatus Sulfotelmatobacter sp.]|nr:TolC family protein [Candidatus Sulfotelmatobacter sp.]
MKSFSYTLGIVVLSFSFLSARAEALPPLTLQQAHETALRNHPRISVAELTALASRQSARQARAGFFPQVSANVVAVGTAENNTRLAAIGALNNPSIFDRNAEGLMISQLITDFGRTANLSQSAKLRARAAEQKTQATREQILLAVDGAFFSALQAQAVTRVAQQTVTNRQVLLDQVSALASNKLRSELDVSFAKVNLEDARLLWSRTQNDLQASFTQLANLMGLTEPRSYQLLEQPLPAPASTNVADFVQQALRQRPDLLSLRNEQQAALRFARAERAARYPTIAAVGSAGVVPIHDPQLQEDAYAAAGLTLTVPLYAGGLYAARQEEAALRAQAAEAAVRDQENNVIRDVRITWLNAQNAFERLQISRNLLENARQSFNLAQARYKEGISSIVELNQAQLNEISAEISYANTQYEYLLQRSALSFQTGVLR